MNSSNASPVKAAVKHSLLRTASVVCTLLVIGGVCWFVYVGMIKPHTNPTATQKAESIINQTYNYPEHKGFINLDLLWGWVKVGLGPPKKAKK